VVAIDVNALSANEQLELFEQLWDALRARAEAAPSALPLTPAQERELDFRLDELDAGDIDGEPAADVVARLRSK
jgi:putative addiction module component (TIGR02574 family)